MDAWMNGSMDTYMYVYIISWQFVAKLNRMFPLNLKNKSFNSKMYFILSRCLIHKMNTPNRYKIEHLLNT